jgi:hypothetical protein
MRAGSLALVSVLMSWASIADAQPRTRAEVIEDERDEKTVRLWPELPRDPTRVVPRQTFDSDFSLFPKSEEEATSYLCGQKPDAPTGAPFYGVVLRFKREGSGILSLLWTREEGNWRLVAYRVFEH